MPEQFGGVRRLFDNSSRELMDISTLVKNLAVVFTACWTGRDVLSLELSYMYPPKIITDENICLLDWTSSKAVCESKTRPTSKQSLYRYDGKEVFFFNMKMSCVLYSNSYEHGCTTSMKSLLIFYVEFDSELINLTVFGFPLPIQKDSFKPYLSY